MKNLIFLLASLTMTITITLSAAPIDAKVDEEQEKTNSDSTSDVRNWQELMSLPTLSEIEEYNKSSVARSPYIGAWLYTQNESAFSQFSIDFKADSLPPATYCSPVNFYIDYSSLLGKYDTVDNGGGISGYGGLQRQIDGIKYNSILSLWDTYCKKTSGETDTIRAKLIQPLEGKVNIYSNEGNGVSFRPDYIWDPRKWYRMLIQLGTSETTGNTTIEQWICDLTEKKWRQLCVFDLGAPDLKFKKNICVFLENFYNKTAGDIRTLEFKNIRIYSIEKQSWVSIYSGYFYNDERATPPKSGSYQYGADDDSFWMITTGLPNCAEPQEPANLTISKSETGNPFNLYDCTVEIDNPIAGNLGANMPEKANYATSLKVSGEINGTDMVTLRRMTGRGENNKATDGIVTCLDLSDAKFVPGGDVYCENYTVTSTDEFPNHGMYWSNLEQVVIPTSISTIGKNSFEMCKHLKNVVIDNNIKRIESCAFNVCPSLKKIELPSSVEYVASYAFWNDDSLSEIVVNAKVPPTAYISSFSNTCYKNAILFVPYGTRGDYSVAEGWKNFANITEMDSTIDAIKNINKKTDSEENARMYNLAGQLVGNDYKGIVLWKGQKILKK